MKIPLNSLTSQQKQNLWFGRPICYMNNRCSEETCRAFQKECKGLDNICYLKEKNNG